VTKISKKIIYINKVN